MPEAPVSTTANLDPDSAKSEQDLKVIDVDTHWSEPLDLWTSRATPKYKDRVPQMRPLNGKMTWMIDRDISMGLSSASSVIHGSGRKADGFEFAQWLVNEVHPGCSQVKPRLAVMDESGVYAQVLYPNVLGFGGQGKMGPGGEISRHVDEDLRLVSTQIYNDAGAEMQADSGGRLMPMALLPWWDIKLAVKEAERCHAVGMRGVNINSDPHLNGMRDLSDTYWTPLWEFCSDKGMPVNFHIGASDSSTTWLGDSPYPSMNVKEKLAVGSTMMFISNAKVLSNLIVSGLLERFPKLKFVSVESGIGWIPFILEALDYQLHESGAWRDGKLSMTPIEYFRRQVFACFWFERQDFAYNARRLGIDNILFETDFPHPTCLYPDPLQSAHAALRDLNEVERRKVLSLNAARCYNIPLE
jgi:predicted TIM-barrel fold metal-dependent hydrolase